MQKLTKTIAFMILIMAMCFVIGCKPEENDDVRVTTYTPQDITQTSAKCGGDVVVTQGLSFDELGMCWSIENNPTVEDAHISTTNWNSTFVCTITGLEPDTKYHVRAYALRGLEYYYGEDKSFTTESGGGIGTYNGHDYVDLGLPSGTLWAISNVGAEMPEAYGYYFAWCETAPKTTYNWSTYRYCMGGYNQLTKYCNNLSYGYNGFTDNLTILQAGDDAATVNWGDGWRTPTYDDWDELLAYCTQTWTTRNGVNGRLFSAPNGNSLFLPAAGYRKGDSLNNVGSHGYYWSSTLYTDYPYNSWYFYFYSGYYDVYNDGRRFYGNSVRPVCSVAKN